ncbi:immunity 50 family protein [Candidatus Gracilibacteria bacterium]|nr:immunity 50 family protein [Candidatus Gracilibacteria bacterium]
MKIPKYIKNWQLIIDYFGYWPTFHDDEILEIKYNSKKKNISMKIESSQWVEYPCITTFLFENIKKDSDYDYKHCPTIAELEFKKQAEGVLVELSPCWIDDNYRGSKWLCDTVIVENVEIIK